MVTIELTNHQAIVAVSAIFERLPKYREYLESSPAIFKPVVEQHIESMLAAAQSLNQALKKEGLTTETEEDYFQIYREENPTVS